MLLVPLAVLIVSALRAPSEQFDAALVPEELQVRDAAPALDSRAAAKVAHEAPAISQAFAPAGVKAAAPGQPRLEPTLAE